jgi:tetratricopeptide (TPR) repeat protein
MIKRLAFCVLFFFCFVQIVAAAPLAKIISISGEVKVRRGIEENWHPAAAGMSLEEIDTILTGEAAAVTLETQEGGAFRLGSYAILDIADLRRITEREMFLYLMSQKVNQIPDRPEKVKLRVGNVSVIHGESKAGAVRNKSEGEESQSWKQETNGAQALYEQGYYPNAVVKLHKVLAKYPNLKECGEVHFNLGKAFEALSKPGQAIDAYKAALDRLCDHDASKQRADEARKAIERLK